MNEALITFIYVDDLERSHRFYGEELALPLVLEQAHCRIYRVSAAGFIGVCASGDRPTTPQGVIITLVRDDVDAYCAELAARGVELEKPPTANERFAIYHAFLRDPDGYLIEVQRFDDPHWAG
jgi:catechol 2,3-dioxygenase-like lactoylglutathione lyase family enzyme